MTRITRRASTDLTRNWLQSPRKTNVQDVCARPLNRCGTVGAGEISGPRKSLRCNLLPLLSVQQQRFHHVFYPNIRNVATYLPPFLSPFLFMFSSSRPVAVLRHTENGTRSTYPKYFQNSEYTLPYSHLNEVGAVLESVPNSVVGLLIPADTVTYTTIHSAAGQNARVISC